MKIYKRKNLWKEIEIPAQTNNILKLTLFFLSYQDNDSQSSPWLLYPFQANDTKMIQINSGQYSSDNFCYKAALCVLTVSMFIYCNWKKITFFTIY